VSRWQRDREGSRRNAIRNFAAGMGFALLLLADTVEKVLCSEHANF
jgi:hypothetical protein